MYYEWWAFIIIFIFLTSFHADYFGNQVKPIPDSNRFGSKCAQE